MLKGIAPCISPELYKVLCEMGAVELLSAILPMFPLDQYDDSNFVLMGVVPGDLVVPEIWNQYDEIL